MFIIIIVLFEVNWIPEMWSKHLIICISIKIDFPKPLKMFVPGVERKLGTK